MPQFIRFERCGYGRSDTTPPYDLQTCLSDLENIRRAYGLEQGTIGGHSFYGSQLHTCLSLKRGIHGFER